MTVTSRRIDEIGNLFPGTKRKLHYVNSPEERTNSCLSYLRLGSFKEKPTLSRFQCCHRQLRSYTERMWNSKPSETCSERGANLPPDTLKSERLLSTFWHHKRAFINCTRVVLFQVATQRGVTVICSSGMCFILFTSHLDLLSIKLT